MDILVMSCYYIVIPGPTFSLVGPGNTVIQGPGPYHNYSYICITYSVLSTSTPSRITYLLIPYF